MRPKGQQPSRAAQGVRRGAKAHQRDPSKGPGCSAADGAGDGDHVICETDRAALRRRAEARACGGGNRTRSRGAFGRGRAGG